MKWAEKEAEVSQLIMRICVCVCLCISRYNAYMMRVNAYVHLLFNTY